MTPTLHPTEAGLLRTVCENPADDDVRLVLADWYEENGQEERGEFVRVQCELATLLDGPPLLPIPTIRRKERIDVLRRRERELLDAHARTEWLFILPPGLRPILPDAIYRTFRRGFVAFVSCRLVDWCGESYPRHCGQWPPGRPDSACALCHGTGYIAGHGPALVQAAPIEQVKLSDRRPLVDWCGEYGWFRRVRNGDISGEESELPADLWKLLPGGFNRRDGQRGAGTWRDYPSQAEAQSALSHAALTWARQQAGLPALS